MEATQTDICTDAQGAIQGLSGKGCTTAGAA